MAAPTQSKNFSSLIELAEAPVDADELFLWDASEGGATDRPKRITFANLKTNLTYPGGTDVAVADGGTGASNAVDARVNLGLDTVINTQVGLTYNVLLSDAYKMISMDNPAANSIILPANSNIPFPIGTEIAFMQLGSGTTTISISTDFLYVEASLTKVLNGQYSVAAVKKISVTTWVLYGNLAAL